MITSPVQACTVRDIRYVAAFDFNFQLSASPFVFNVNAALARDGTEFLVICEGPGDILVQNTNGAGASDFHIMKAGEVFPIDDIVVNTLIITYISDDSAFRIVAL